MTVHEAQVPVDYGSTTAAPFARQILEDALPYLGVMKSDPSATAAPQMTVPDVTGMTLAEARKALTAQMLSWETDGVGQTVTAQAPAAGAPMPAGGKVMLYTYENQPLQAVDVVSVPDVRGMSMVEAGRMLRARGFEMEVSGSGLAVRQEPGAGTFAALGDTVKVTFALPQETE